MPQHTLGVHQTTVHTGSLSIPFLYSSQKMALVFTKILVIPLEERNLFKDISLEEISLEEIFLEEISLEEIF